ncbi:hypothetical protein NKI79_18470 [Mesorhizobium sp. M0340]|uniref:hypothetical protein n=1 Tax=Mesorhizobium sp. M0340 TaxID=2956939 RepID=UPI00333C4719
MTSSAKDLIPKGYIGELSTHSRGSTVEVAIARIDHKQADHKSAPKPACGATDADMLDFGTGFECSTRRAKRLTDRSPVK